MSKPNSKVRLKDFDASRGLDRGASKPKEICWYLIKMVFFLSAFPFPSSLKVFLLRIFGAKIGEGVRIKPRVNIHFPWKLLIGNDVWIGEEVLILNFEEVKIGNNVCISQRAFLCGGNHDYRKASMPYNNGPIYLKNGCWVGACTFIGPNVTVGIDSVITVGSMITKSIPENQIVTKSSVLSHRPRWR